MKVMVIGSGGREHALCWALSRSPKVEKVYAVPGNGGTSAVAENVDLDIHNMETLARFAKNNGVDLTIPGSETVLAEGIVDTFIQYGLAICGPTKAAAELESSKAFAKDMMRAEGIPTAEYASFERYEDAERYIMAVERKLVVKADGLCAGKGAIVCDTREEALAAAKSIMTDKVFGTAGNRLVIEERLVGEEVSLLALTDGKTIAPLASAQDHKRVGDGDTGLNTGGMGAYSPAPVLTDALLDVAIEKILVPTVHAMNRMGRRYKGVLYAGLMLTKSGLKVIEFNCRLGDPETQPILMRLDTDLAELLMAVTQNKLDEMELKWKDEAAVSVVMASGGYPGKYENGKEILGITAAETIKGVQVFHAGTKDHFGKTVTNGGRVLNVTALGKDIPTAIAKAYEAANLISFEGAHYRTDIGKRALDRK